MIHSPSSLSPPEGWVGPQLRPAAGGSGDPGGERGFPQGPGAPGRGAPHRRGLQEQRARPRGLPGDRVQRSAIAWRGRGAVLKGSRMSLTPLAVDKR